MLSLILGDQEEGLSVWECRLRDLDIANALAIPDEKQISSKK